MLYDKQVNLCRLFCEHFFTWMQQHRRHLFIAGPLLLIIVIILFYLLDRHEVSTDDAYTRAGNAAISSNVAGKISAIYVHDNQPVKKGQILFRINQQPYEIAVARAQAEFDNMSLTAQALKTVYQEKAAHVKGLKDTTTYQHTELERQQKMTTAGLSSQMTLDKTKNAFNTAKQQLAAARQQQANILIQLNNNPDIAIEDIPSVKTALANLHQAELNLSYTTIKAPFDGTVTKVDNAQVGDYIQVGAPVFSLMSHQDIWIEANFKETQITHIVPGDKAEISIDAFPEKKWVGHVASITPGTGSTFALLPPENATGNWVKIVQRIPIRIAFDALNNQTMPSGLSANVTVITTGQSHE